MFPLEIASVGDEDIWVLENLVLVGHWRASRDQILALDEIQVAIVADANPGIEERDLLLHHLELFEAQFRVQFLNERRYGGVFRHVFPGAVDFPPACLLLFLCFLREIIYLLFSDFF